MTLPVRSGAAAILLGFISCSSFDSTTLRLEGDSRADSLLFAERSFAALARSTDTRNAFLAFLSDSSILFRPHPVDGITAMTAQPVRPNLLAWEPTFADVSTSGEYGYTTGPAFQARRASPDSILWYGQFVTFWARSGKGDWKVQLDVGISTDPPATIHQKPVTGPLSTLPRVALWEKCACNETVEEAEARLGEALRTAPPEDAYRGVLAGDARLYRDGRFPLVGRELAISALAAISGKLVCEPIRSWRSAAGDLGCVYGTYSRRVDEQIAEHGYYVRIWRSFGGERMHLVLDLLSPVSS